MDFDVYDAIELGQSLEILLEDAPSKIRDDLERVISALKVAKKNDDLLRIQDELEALSNNSNLDSFSRSEIMNAITTIETIVNS